ncbi:hypothetical protein DL765_009392 [Monosporascus sp. GIB2]|nr:hypothetical protein DL765_009392 [Monosporascus sp. GIB2]
MFDFEVDTQGYDPAVAKYVLKSAEGGVVQEHEVPIGEFRANPGKFKQPWAPDTNGWEYVVDKDLDSPDWFRNRVRLYYLDLKVLGDG